MYQVLIFKFRRHLCKGSMQKYAFHVVFLQRTGTKCTKTYNARAQSLFRSFSKPFHLVTFSLSLPWWFAYVHRSNFDVYYLYRFLYIPGVFQSSLKR